VLHAKLRNTTCEVQGLDRQGRTRTRLARTRTRTRT